MSPSTLPPTACLALLIGGAACTYPPEDPPPACPTLATLATRTTPGRSPGGYEAVLRPNAKNPALHDLVIRGKDGANELVFDTLFGVWFGANVLWDDQDRLWMQSSDFGTIFYAQVTDLRAPPCPLEPWAAERWDTVGSWVLCSPDATHPAPPLLLEMEHQELWCSTR